MNTSVGAGTHAFDFYFNFNLLEQPLNIKVEVKSVFSCSEQGSELKRRVSEVKTIQECNVERGLQV